MKQQAVTMFSQPSYLSFGYVKESREGRWIRMLTASDTHPWMPKTAKQVVWYRLVVGFRLHSTYYERYFVVYTVSTNHRIERYCIYTRTPPSCERNENRRSNPDVDIKTTDDSLFLVSQHNHIPKKSRNFGQVQIQQSIGFVVVFFQKLF